MRTIRLFLVPILTSILVLIPFVGVFLYAVILYDWYKRNQKNIHAYFVGQDRLVGNIEYNEEQFGYLKNGESMKNLK